MPGGEAVGVDGVGRVGRGRRGEDSWCQIGRQAGPHGRLLASMARRIGVDAGLGDGPISFARVAARPFQ